MIMGEPAFWGEPKNVKQELVKAITRWYPYDFRIRNSTNEIGFPEFDVRFFFPKGRLPNCRYWDEFIRATFEHERQFKEAVKSLKDAIPLKRILCPPGEYNKRYGPFNF